MLADALRHGILLERHAEFVTDALRAALLEWAGYETKVFEFISTEHTAKNLMIAAVKRSDPLPLPLVEPGRATLPRSPNFSGDHGSAGASPYRVQGEGVAAKVRDLAALYGIREQRLAKHLGFTLAAVTQPA